MNWNVIYSYYACFLLVFIILLFAIRQHFKLKKQLVKLSESLEDTLKNSINDRQSIELTIHENNHMLLKELHSNNEKMLTQIHQTQLSHAQHTADSIQKNMQDIREQLNHSFKYHADSLSQHVKSLNEEVKTHLKSITQQVNKQLDEGFNKTSATFHDVIKRLAIIDEAQKKITDLSNNVVSLQDILNDKRSRGAFGEVQLSSLIKNALPPQHYAFQHSLSNHKRVDCILFLPPPTGNIVIDAKFPLENYQSMSNLEIAESDRKKYQQQFRQDIKRHITDIEQKYILKNETAEGALMFIPAEAIFAEIHAYYPELVAISHKSKVWLVSPSTLMAVLTTVRAVLKDDATKKQVHIIQEHLQYLSKDFTRFEKRMNNLSRHIDQAQQDVSEVHTSAKKISQRFHRIEQLDVDETPKVLTNDNLETSE